MKFFINTANLARIREAQDLGVLDGITTNPSLMAEEGITGKETTLKHYISICAIVEGDVSARVTATDLEGIVHRGEGLVALHLQIVVKVPMIRDGIKAIKYFADKSIRANYTSVFSTGQTLLAAEAGVTYVSPFIGRFDDISVGELSLIGEIRLIYDNCNFETQILAAPIRHAVHIPECAKIGADVITALPSTITGLLEYPLTDNNLTQFPTDTGKLG